MSEEKLELRYVPLDQAKRWDENPKRHDFEALMRSIELHGFGDPPKYDATLDGLVYGNGRTEALERLRAAGDDPPRGVLQLDGGEWAIPVIFGVDAESRAAAVAFAVDHNNLTMLGGGLDAADLLAVWDEEGLQRVLDDLPDVGDFLSTLDVGDLDLPSVSWEDALGALPEGDGDGFQEMTFKLTDAQVEVVRKALKKAKKTDFPETGNENSNGNALERIAEAYLGAG